MKLWGLGIAVASIVWGCGGGGGGGGGGQAASASGVAVKGPVANATVTVFEIRDTGTLGELIGTGTTDAAGEFNVQISGYIGWAVACVVDGTFVDEATGATVTIPLDKPLYGFVDVQIASTDFAITPITTIAVPLMMYFAHDPEATVDDSVDNALTSVESLFGLVDIDILRPADLTAGVVAPGASADYAAVIAGISKLAESESVTTMEMIQALAEDAEDGRFDGTNFGTNVPLGAGTLSPTAGTADLAVAIADFLASPQNASGLTDADTLVDDNLAASSGDFDWPIQIRSLVNGYSDVTIDIAALLEATLFPANPQVLIDAQVLVITSQTAQELGFDIPAGLPLGKHDLVVRDLDTGLATRLRDAIEVADLNAAPTVTEIAPHAGPLSGGTFLQLRGTNFGPNTEVEVDGVLAIRLAQDFPRWMVVATPPHAAGSVSVTVLNNALSVTVPNGFEYRSGDTRANPNVPSATTPIVYGAFRNYVDAANGFTAQALAGRSSFTNSDSGTFSLTDYTATDVAPAIATRQRSGSTFQATQSLGKTFLLFDSVSIPPLSDFVRGSTNEENGVSMGTTAFGPACFFPEPTNMQVSTVAQSYWVSGTEVNIGLSTVRQKTGWLELDTSFEGSASFLSHGRDFDGTAFDLDSEKWQISYSLDVAGRFQGQRTVGTSTESLVGHFSAGADLGFLIQNGSDGTLGYYLMTPIERGVEAAGWGGWTGGYLKHEIADDGMGGQESAFESGSYRGLIADIVGGDSHLAFNRATRLTESDRTGTFSEYVGAAELDISPSGRLFDGDNLAGYVNSYGGILLLLGEFPNECLLNGGVDLPMVCGGAVFRDSRKSFLSLEPTYKQVAIETKFLEVGATHHQELGTDMFDVSLDPITTPVVMGVTIPMAGTIPELEGAAIIGIHKSTVRDSTGTVTTTRGSPPAWGVQAGYSFIDDLLDVYATNVTQIGGRFGGASMPRWIASGVLGNDGQVASLRGSDQVLGDTFMMLVANRNTALTKPNYTMKGVGLAFEPNAGGPSGVTSSSSELAFDGTGGVAVTIDSRTQDETGAFTPGNLAGAGVNAAPVGQEMRINIPTGGADREWQTIWTPSADSFVGIDDTPNLDRAELLISVRPAIIGSFVDDDRPLIIMELNPQTSRATTQQLLLTPRSGSIMTGEILTSQRAATYSLVPNQSFASTAAADVGMGEATVTINVQPPTPVLNFLFSQRDEAAGQEDLLLNITPRIIHSLDL